MQSSATDVKIITAVKESIDSRSSFEVEKHWDREYRE